MARNRKNFRELLKGADRKLLKDALAGANWKRFHLAYAKHLIGTSDHKKQNCGLRMVVETHLRMGMSLDDVRRLFEPARVPTIDIAVGSWPPSGRPPEVSAIRWLRMDDGDD